MGAHARACRLYSTSQTLQHCQTAPADMWQAVEEQLGPLSEAPTVRGRGLHGITHSSSNWTIQTQSRAVDSYECAGACFVAGWGLSCTGGSERHCSCRLACSCCTESCSAFTPQVPALQPLVVVISGPSGVGKDAVIKALQAARPNLHFVVTATSRCAV